MTTEAAQTSVLNRRSVGGTVWVAAGLAVLGAAGYVFLTLTARVPEYAAALASLYLLVSVIGPGIFGAFELEVSRLVSRFGATGQGHGAVVRQLGLLAAGVLGVVALLLAALSPVLVGRIFNGDAMLLVSLGLAAATYAVITFPRGMLAGQRRLKAFAVTLAAEGFTRLIPTIVLAVAGVMAASAYGLAFVTGPLLAAIICLLWVGADRSGPRLGWSELTRAVGWLMASSLLALALANLGPVIVTALLTADPGRAAIFAFVFVLFRVPHFVFVSLQTVLLPMFSRAAATGDVAGLRKAIKQAVVVVLGFGLLSGAVLVVIAPIVVDIVIGPGRNLPVSVMILLALGNTAFMLVQQVLQQGLLSVAGHRWVAIAWAVGMALFAGAFLLPIDPVHAAIVAQYAGVAATGALLLYGLRSAFANPALARRPDLSAEGIPPV
jgi:O-antigen/teichoic acid export membrane protein